MSRVSLTVTSPGEFSFPPSPEQTLLVPMFVSILFCKTWCFPFTLYVDLVGKSTERRSIPATILVFKSEGLLYHRSGLLFAFHETYHTISLLPLSLTIAFNCFIASPFFLRSPPCRNWSIFFNVPACLTSHLFPRSFSFHHCSCQFSPNRPVRSPSLCQSNWREGEIEPRPPLLERPFFPLSL